ncbi:Adenylate kinase, active site lid [Musa troglodytarum]|uniref:adenylate kinase n=1 Tax=Musa troglodytarum TaxID=320322 RepID=A0A9E7JRZ1_9LILI|nr:Adenylate kinase, active site lid [Musa troglodytarum]
MKLEQPVKIIIWGAPASGKGTQSELIEKNYGLVHIAAGDLLRAEVTAETENGKRAKEYMEKGMMVPDEVVVTIVKARLSQPDAEENGWVLDGYPRSLSQVNALQDLRVRPDMFILLEVSEESLIERVVGRRLDPVTGKIYHLKYSPPENKEISSRLTLRCRIIVRMPKMYLQYIGTSYLSYVNGDAPKEDVFTEIDKKLSSIVEKRSKNSSKQAANM